MSGFGKFITGLFIVIALAFFSGGFNGTSSDKTTTQSKSSTPTATAPTATTPTSQASKTPSWQPPKSSKPTYQDARWPTTNPELLAIPESDRWYNAYSKIGEYGTIAGPVKSVYQAKDSPGMPVFINIGADYPSAERAQVVLWAEDVPYCEDMLNAISHGGSWISISGQISLYDGVPEINFSDGPVTWTYWTR